MTSPQPFDCDQVFARLDDYVDRELSPEEMVLVAQHIEICADCALDARFETDSIVMLRQKLSRITLPESLRDTISARIAEAARG